MDAVIVVSSIIIFAGESNPSCGERGEDKIYTVHESKTARANAEKKSPPWRCRTQFLFPTAESLKTRPTPTRNLIQILQFNFRNQHAVQTNFNSSLDPKYPNGFRLIRNNYKNLRSSGFNSSYQTKVIIHGYINNYTSAAIQLPKNAYLSSGKFNVIAVDWSEYAFPYVLAASSAKPVGHMTGMMVSFLMNAGGLRSSDLHFVGHSLGAHVAGFAVERIGSKPARITGLDPAAPIFSESPPSNRLGEEDAEFVDVIHTSVRVLGMTQNIGHADFYPAGGKHQPRCPSDLVEEVIGSCDHGQSYIYFAESIRNKNLFPAVKCRSLSDALDRRCKGRKTAIMGESAIYRKPRGIFYVDVHALEQSFKNSNGFPLFRKSRKNSLFGFAIF